MVSVMTDEVVVVSVFTVGKDDGKVGQIHGGGADGNLELVTVRTDY